MMTRRHSDAVLGQGHRLQAALALYPGCFLYNHRPGFEFANLVDAPLRIFVGTDDDLDDGQGACEALIRDLAPADAVHLSLRVFANAAHGFDGFDGAAEFGDPLAHHGQGGITISGLIRRPVRKRASILCSSSLPPSKRNDAFRTIDMTSAHGTSRHFAAMQ
jgi:dienelactone hydrolase